MELMNNPVDLDNYDPMDREVQQCPFDHYAALQASGPVFFHEPSGMYFVSRHEVVMEVIRDTTTFSSESSNKKTVGSPEVTAQVDAILAKGWPRAETLLTVDPPRQTKYRRLVAKTFSPRRIAELEDKVREIAVDLIADFPEKGPIDFHAAFGVALPVRVIHHVLNMAPETRHKVKEWSDAANVALGVEPSDEARYEAAQLGVDMQAYFHTEYEDRLANPVDDVISELAHADFDDPDLPDGETRKLGFPEVYGIVRQLMVAGNETTTMFLNETMRLLIDNPERWSQLEDDPEGMVNGLVEEGLRLSSPNQGMFRQVTCDTELHGVFIPKGSRLWLIFAAANRDEGLFADPGSFDPTRTNLKEHFAFGKGVHFCIGAPLSRLEGRVAFEELVKRVKLPAFSEGNTFEYEPSYVMRGLAQLGLDIEKR
ncbi:MAG: cytochrome P450 [Ilumatobacter sp.]|nr:cytochrome P450 [Ilumatobacter sp.]